MFLFLLTSSIRLSTYFSIHICMCLQLCSLVYELSNFMAFVWIYRFDKYLLKTHLRNKITKKRRGRSRSQAWVGHCFGSCNLKFCVKFESNNNCLRK